MRAVICLSVLLLTACGGDGGSSTPAAEPQSASPATEPRASVVANQNSLNQTIEGELVERTFFVRMPEEQTAQSYPLVFFFHGAGGSGEGLLQDNPAIGALIDAGEFIGIFPDGYQQRWNVSGETSADDREFISLIANSLGADSIYNLDRTYGVGISNGAGLVNKIAKETSIFKGIAPLISQQTVELGNTVPSAPVSVFQLNGANDQQVPLEGGLGVADTNFMSAQASAEDWATNYNCNTTPAERSRSWGEQQVLEYTFNGCLNNKKVRYHIVEAGEHNVDFGAEFNLYQTIWRFFKSTDRDQALNLKLLSLGDSYTIGQSVCETCSFPQQLRENLVFEYSDRDSIGLQVIAETGWTTSELINAVDSENPARDFDLVTLLIGVNNQFQSRPFEVYETEFITLVNRAISFVGDDPAKLIVVSIPDYAYTPFGEFRNPADTSAGIDRYNNFARDYCQENGLSYNYITDITRQGLDNPDLVAADRLHPSTLAYSKFVERLLPVALDKLDRP